MLSFHHYYYYLLCVVILYFKKITKQKIMSRMEIYVENYYKRKLVIHYITK